MRTNWKAYLSPSFVSVAVILWCAMWLVGFALPPQTVVLTVDGTQRQVTTSARSAAGILQEAGVPLGSHDRVMVTRDKATGDTRIEVVRGVPITVTDGATTSETVIAARTVGEAARALGYDLTKYTPLQAETDPLLAGMTVTMAPCTKDTVEVEETIAYETIVQPNDRMRMGEEHLVTAGQNGKRKVTYERVMVNGKELRRHAVASVEVTAPVTEVREAGTRSVVTTSRGDIRFSKVMEMEATAYHPMDGDGRGITASGIPATYGVVAVDPDVIPLGTRVFIPGYGEAIAADTGGAIQGARIDLCMEDYDEAFAFGRRMTEVYILN